MWQTVNNAKGSYNATIQPSWWNSTSAMTLQLSIVASGTPPFLSPFPAGPVFKATNSTPSSGNAASSNSGITTVNNMGAIKKSLAPGRTAAAVLMPLLIVAVLIGLYIRRSRSKGKEQRKRFSEAVDKRMSTISTDWKSLSGAGANAAIRNSIAISGNRGSSFSFGAIRPTSTFGADGGQAGVGARGLYSQENTSIDSHAPVMSQLRPGLRTSAFGERVSRVSFANDPRPSAESRRTVTSRAFHSAFTPPVPELPRQGSDGGQTPGRMSPTQTAGPLTLSPEDIRARFSGQKHNGSTSVDEVMPALSSTFSSISLQRGLTLNTFTVMRTGGEGSSTGDDDNDYLLPSPMTSPTLPKPPTPSHPKSPVGMMPMQPMPANVMSPDEMLRAYAEQRRPGTSTSAVSFPTPIVNYNGNGMRTLYSPTTPTTPMAMVQAPPVVHGQDIATDRRYRMSRANTVGSQYSGEYDVSVGTAE